MILIFLIRFVGLERKRLGRHRFLVSFALKAKPFTFASVLYLFLLHDFFGISRQKNILYFTDHRIAKIIQLFVAIKGNISGIFFF